MSARTLESVLAEHAEVTAPCGCSLGPHQATVGCECDQWDDSACTYETHVAAEVRAWIVEALAGEGLREDVARSILADDLAKGRAADLWCDGADEPWLLDEATAALTTVAAHMTAGATGGERVPILPRVTAPATDGGESHG